MLSLLKKIICNLILFVLPLTCLLSLGCGKGAYDEKLETAVQRAASGTPREKKQDDASLEELYPLADDDEDADADEDDGYEDEDDADADDPDADDTEADDEESGLDDSDLDDADDNPF